MFLVRNESPSRGVGCSPGSRSSGSKLSQTPLFLNCQVPMLFFMSYKFICFFYLFMLKLMIVVSVFLRVHNPSAWKLKKFTSFWHLNVGMILIRQCVQTMLLLIIDFTPPLYYVLHLFWGDTYDLVASFSSSCQCWFYWHGSRPQHRSALLVGRWFFFLPKI